MLAMDSVLGPSPSRFVSKRPSSFQIRNHRPVDLLVLTSGFYEAWTRLHLDGAGIPFSGDRNEAAQSPPTWTSGSVLLVHDFAVARVCPDDTELLLHLRHLVPLPRP